MFSDMIWLFSHGPILDSFYIMAFSAFRIGVCESDQQGLSRLIDTTALIQGILGWVNIWLVQTLLMGKCRCLTGWMSGMLRYRRARDFRSPRLFNSHGDQSDAEQELLFFISIWWQLASEMTALTMESNSKEHRRQTTKLGAQSRSNRCKHCKYWSRPNIFCDL